MKKKESIDEFVGMRYNMLTIISDLGSLKRDRTVLVKCDCGNIKPVVLLNVRKGLSKSCGCLIKERTKDRNKTHGLTHHPLYSVFNGIKKRCYLHTDKSYKNYGGRGVRICDEWLNDVSSFVSWAISNGWKTGMQIDKDRKAMKLGVEALIYSPEMCSVVTNKENTWSRRSSKMVEYMGEVKCIAEWGDVLNIPIKRLYKRLSQLKMPIEKAFSGIELEHSGRFKIGHKVNSKIL